TAVRSAGVGGARDGADAFARAYERASSSDAQNRGATDAQSSDDTSATEAGDRAALAGLRARVLPAGSGESAGSGAETTAADAAAEAAAAGAGAAGAGAADGAPGAAVVTPIGSSEELGGAGS